jgi:plastocyanin
MKHVPVTFTLNATKTDLDVHPPRPVVDPGDTIAWTCPDGAITVSFDTSVAFERGSKFQASKGGQTENVKIRLDVPRGQFFQCHVTFNGQPMPVSYGFDTSGSGG